MDAPRIVKTEQANVLVAGVGAVPIFRVHFMVGENGPFVEDFKRPEFTPENVRQRMNEIAATLHALEG